MITKQTKFKPEVNNAVCPDCGSTRFRAGAGKVICTECGTIIADKTYSKYRNVRQTYNNYNYDSKLEARVAADLDLQVKCGAIKSWERQLKLPLYAGGVFICNYYCDFRIANNDGTYELLEVKSRATITEVYRLKRKLFEAVWLSEHPDHSYTVTIGEYANYGRKSS